MTIVDTHCHGGANWFEPVELLLYQMNVNSVDKAVLIQHGGTYDNRYLFECVERFPDRFAVVVMVDTSDQEAPQALEKWAALGAVGVRLGPTVRSTGPDPLAIWRKAEELGLVVSSLGDVEEFASDDFNRLVGDLPNLPIVIEHLAGVRQGAQPPYATFKRALALARHPNTYIKVGGLGEISVRPPVLQPHFAFDDAPPLIEMTGDAFGPRRMMWGSDFPPVSGREGYRNALNGVAEHPAFKSGEDREWVMGKTALSVFRFGEPSGLRDRESQSGAKPSWAWSPWYPQTGVAAAELPSEPGVFETRMQWTDSVLYVGVAVGQRGLSEALGNRAAHPDAHLSGYEKELVGQGRPLEFRFAVAMSVHQAEQRQAELLHEYMDSHGGQVPPGNDAA